MTVQDLLELLNFYKSQFSGEQIDEAIGAILNGKVDDAVAQALNYAVAAKKSAEAAATSESNAATASTTVQRSARLSESWAVGGTGERGGEDTNNARYYAELAKTRRESISLKAADWVLSDAVVFGMPVYTQPVSFTAVTTNTTLVVLPVPSNAQMDQLQSDGVLLLRIDNKNGVDTSEGSFEARAVGAQAPTKDMSLQAILLEG